MRKSRKWPITVIAVIVVLALGYRIYRGLKTRPSSLSGAVLATATVEKRDLAVTITGKGTVDSTDKRQIKAKVAGTVTAVLVSEGSYVKEGDTLILLSNDTAQLQLEQARLEAALAKESLNELLGPGGARDKLSLNLRQAEVNLASAEERAEALSIRAPISGQLWDLNLTTGDRVRAGEIVASVVDNRSYVVVAKVKQEDLSRIKTGEHVMIYAGGEIGPCPGLIEEVSNQGVVAGKSAEFQVKVRVEDPSPFLRPGMSVTVTYNPNVYTSLSFPGQVEPYAKKNVVAEVDGTVKFVLSATGSWVDEGQELIRLENDQIALALEQVKSSVEAARQELASWENQVEQQRLKVRQAELNLQEKEKAVQNLTVKSPLTGKVISLSARPGDDVSTGQVLAQVASVDPLVVTIPVDELDIAKVYQGQTAFITVDAFPGKSWEGKVRRIAEQGQVREGITNYNVEVEFTAEEVKLSMSSTVSILLSKEYQVLTVPLEAIKWEGKKSYVYVVQGERVVQRSVVLGVQDEMYIEVRSGLSEGETVLTGDLGRINDPRALRLPTQVPGVPFRPR